MFIPRPAVAPDVPPALPQRLRERIRRDGPLSWRLFMDAALYDPDGGFYAKGRHPAGLGTGTHFATSPTLHPFFALCIARELAQAWKDACKPSAWEIVEFGAGTGALARDAMQELRRLAVPARWSAIDVRPGPAIKGGQWLSRPPARFDAVVANEFLDALAFDLYEWHGGAWHELGVGTQGLGFAWVRLGRGPALDPSGTVDGERRVRMPCNDPWLTSLAQGGARLVLVVDYGEAHPATAVRAFKGHDFTDPLAEPGSVDLTADVDFDELLRQAAQHGFDGALETQEAFLIRHGALEAINKVDRTTREGASSYLRFRQLLLPTGFGTAFKVAVLRRN